MSNQTSNPNIKDFNMPLFNYDVNHSGDLEVKYKAWQSHRQQITDMVLQAATQGGRLLVLGAGECNDIDLKRLAEYFSQVVLTDVDTKSMLEGVRRQKLTKQQRNGMLIKGVEYTGLESAGYFEKLTNLVNSRAIVDTIVHTIGAQAADMPKPVLVENGNFDVVLSLPVYTQLVYSQMETLAKLMNHLQIYTKSEAIQVLEAAQGLMPNVLTAYNLLILKNASLKGHALVFSDVVEMTTDEMVLKARRLTVAADHQALEKFEQANALKWAKIGFASLFQQSKIKDKQYMLWPFDDEKSYLVKGVIVQV